MNEVLMNELPKTISLWMVVMEAQMSGAKMAAPRRRHLKGGITFKGGQKSLFT